MGRRFLHGTTLFAGSHLWLYCLPMFHIKDVRLIRVNFQISAYYHPYPHLLRPPHIIHALPSGSIKSEGKRLFLDTHSQALMHLVESSVLTAINGTLPSMFCFVSVLLYFMLKGIASFERGVLCTSFEH